ncbi:CoA-transferase family III [Wilcoxina mikolae CBS 423.85]|nr:CoA-transferase family III [Wilcoxina mikolae CBS 423.85]
MADLEYSIPSETLKLLIDGIVNNPLHQDAPAEIHDAVKHIFYEGNASPVIPINWRLAESISAIKGFQAAMINILLKRKYGLDEYPTIKINTDHAQLFIMSAVVTQVLDPITGGPLTNISDPATLTRLHKYFPNKDLHSSITNLHDRLATNIYRTRDGQFYHIHGSLNPEPTQRALGLPNHVQPPPTTQEEAAKPYEEKVAQLDVADIDTLMNDSYRQAGTICWSKEEYLASEQGKANAHVGLYELHRIPITEQPPTWWTTVNDLTSAKRPLYGLKVVELARIIAAPTVTRELAELGASVMRITAPHISDMSILFPDLSWGKWQSELDLRLQEHRDQLKTLILEADVVLDGYRPGVMQKWGFGKDDILKMCEKRTKGIIYARENCYGWYGPWSTRSGWQQISDACCGVSRGFGRAMGNDEPVTPVFPNSDYCTGTAGSTGILQALIERAEKGGSYVLDIALNYYSQWLVNSCGEYPQPIWEKLWDSHDRPVFRHNDNMLKLLQAYMYLLKKNAGTILFNPEFFQERETRALGIKLRMPKPVLQFPQGEVELGYNVGTRGNGVDKPVWPEDLSTEIVGG